MNTKSNKKQAVRVYFSIRPDEWEIQGLYQYLSSLPDDSARAHAIRQILFFIGLTQPPWTPTDYAAPAASSRKAFLS